MLDRFSIDSRKRLDCGPNWLNSHLTKKKLNSIFKSDQLV